MRTTVIPAQITTVEDKIAGNFNLTQILLLLASLFIAVGIYAVLPARLHFSVYKIPLIIAGFFVCCTLALRIKDRVVLNWLFILAGYYLRPAYYVSDKNDVYLRDIVLEPILKKKAKKAVRLNRAGNEKEAPMFDPDSVERILGISRAKLSFKFDKEGINAVWQAKK
ncbi:hypothetical protein A3J19_01100 [Candidatus Daviesbacteria bacterium RIFCSPLOWO2_02_FULL_41_8]|uniref:PrgI family protein n=1 Tax=Candidatus Daviesbacteria bacterium RIFCSPLOWO2_02_FULL_41_8 TaxID=1797798 RepID=A0A1F5NK38_9BACT|nr:MAG: hypothetical protein A3J19_01100 [Candidatus Daviesbacteria bacterium RIFCSPLOWO2_02_FULL_41_8]